MMKQRVLGQGSRQLYIHIDVYRYRYTDSHMSDDETKCKYIDVYRYNRYTDSHMSDDETKSAMTRNKTVYI